MLHNRLGNHILIIHLQKQLTVQTKLAIIIILCMHIPTVTAYMHLKLLHPFSHGEAPQVSVAIYNVLANAHLCLCMFRSVFECMSTPEVINYDSGLMYNNCFNNFCCFQFQFMPFAVDIVHRCGPSDIIIPKILVINVITKALYPLYIINMMECLN